MTPSPRPGSTRQARAGFEYAMGTVARANALVAAWRWRYELAAVAGLAAMWAMLGTTVAVALTAGLAAVLALSGVHRPGAKVPRRSLVVHRDAASRPDRLRSGLDPLTVRQDPHRAADQVPAVR